MFWVLSPPGPTDWRVELAELRSALRESWPDFALGGPEPGSKTRVLTWLFQGEDAWLDGSQDMTGQSQYLTGTPEMVATYAAWWRGRVPPTQPLLLYDEGFSHVIELTPAITAALIRAQMGEQQAAK
jgi:hypothetical protein